MLLARARKLGKEQERISRTGYRVAMYI